MKREPKQKQRKKGNRKKLKSNGNENEIAKHSQIKMINVQNSENKYQEE